MAEPAVLDMSVVDDLRASVDGDEEFIADVIRAYLAEGPANLAAMAAAAESGDGGAVVRPAHTLKSSSAAIGALRMSTVCREIELAGRDGSVEGMRDRVGQAHTVWALTVAAITEAGLA